MTPQGIDAGTHFAGLFMTIYGAIRAWCYVKYWHERRGLLDELGNCIIDNGVAQLWFFIIMAGMNIVHLHDALSYYADGVYVLCAEGAIVQALFDTMLLAVIMCMLVFQQRTYLLMQTRCKGKTDA